MVGCGGVGDVIEMRVCRLFGSSERGGAAHNPQPLPCMATAQLRKAFKYPSDYSDEDDIPPDLDEEGSSYYCLARIVSN